jgi:hypothetical protein
MIVVVEGDTDLPHVRKLVEETGLVVTSEVHAGSKGSINRDTVLLQYPGSARGAAMHIPFLHTGRAGLTQAMAGQARGDVLHFPCHAALLVTHAVFANGVSAQFAQ